ncbi:MAG: YqgE/AlgH family protein [Ilumatobacteraceae bacterium]|jgi:putative transcriptional regulator|nr:YqgE/AlgH family protein [Ilumatobacteraceae bacterium]
MHNYASTPGLDGKLLVARPDLDDPNFIRACVYVLAHNDEGALGVILNRPLPSPSPHYGPTIEDAAVLHDVLRGWIDSSVPPAALFEGGPVEPHGVFGLLEDDSSPHGIRSIDIDEDSSDGPGRWRFFRGYSGWGPDQLDDEIRRDGWFVLDAFTDDVYTREPLHLWRTVLARQVGEVASLAHFPDDPNLN